MVRAMAASLVFVTVAGSGVHEERAAQIAAVQQTPGVLWRAAAQPRFAAHAPGASKSLMGVKAGWAEHVREGIREGRIRRHLMSGRTDIPEEFDSEQNWPECAKIIGDIRDQSNCGCCWAFAAAESASDRLCISTNGKVQVPLSAQDVCFCGSDDGCDGGMVDEGWEYIKESGAVTGGQYQGTGPFGKGMCVDFSLPHCHHHGPQGDDPYPAEGEPGCPSAESPACPKACDAEASDEHKDFASDKWSFSGEVISASGEQAIQEALMAGGPVETAFTVYSDFENYAGGIYHHVTGEMAGGHAVKLVGWGVEDGNKYWKVANSWNPYWGEKGYFRIKRGNNEGGIEDTVVASDPAAKWSQGSGLVV